MNTIFKIIFNQATQSFVVVSELAKGRTKASSRTSRRLFNLTRIGAALSLALGSSAVMANPPVSGTGTTCVVDGITVACADGSVAVTEGSIAIGEKAKAGMATMEATDSDFQFSGKPANEIKPNDKDYRYRVGKRNNIAIGSGAEAAGGRVVSIGQGAGAGITNNWNTHNVNIGSAAGVRAMGTDNLFLGRNAGGINLQDTQAPSDNVLQGEKGMQGNGNIVLGVGAGQSAGVRDNPNGYTNSVFDKTTGAKGTSENILIGRNAGNGMYNGTGTNIFIGSGSGVNHKSLAKEFNGGFKRADGTFASPYSPYVNGLNVGIGGIALSDSEGELNTAAGWKAGWQLSGSNNTAMGYLSQFNLKGDGNAALGPWAGSNSNGNKNVAVGSEAGVGISADHTVAVGDTAKGMADHSTAISSLSVAQGESSIAVGRNAYVGDKEAYLAEAGKLSAANADFSKADDALTKATRATSGKAADVKNKENALEREKTGLANNQKKLDEENAKQKPSEAAVKLWTQRVADSNAKIEKAQTALEKAKQELAENQAAQQTAQTALNEKKAAQEAAQGVYNKFMADAASKYDSAIAMGKDSKAVNTSAIAIGKQSEATGMNSMAEGTEAKAVAQNSIAQGTGALAGNTNDATKADDAGIGTIAIGHQAKAELESAIAMGTNANAKGKTSVAIGQDAVAGNNPSADGNDLQQAATAIGRQAQATGGSSSALGSNAKATALYTVALGAASTASGAGAIAAGVQSVASGGQSIAQGRAAQASGENAIALGSSGNVSGANSGAIGKSNTVAQENTFVLGNDVTATQANSVVLGNESTDKAAKAVNEATVNGITYSGFAGQGAPEKGVVSVGKEGGERQIVNVAAGEISATSTDAINGSQLYLTQEKLGDVKKEVEKGRVFAGDKLDPAAEQTLKNEFTQALGEQTNVKGEAEGELSDKNIGVLSNGKDTLTVKLAKNIDLTKDGSVKLGDTTINNNGLTIENGPSITNGGVNAGNKVISNVAPGKADTDAVNVSQLNELKNAGDNGGFGLSDTNGEKVTQDLGKQIQLKGVDGVNVTAKPGDKELEIGLANDITIGKPAKDGQAGEAGAIGVTGKDGKDGVSIKGDAGDGKPGISIAGKDGKDGVSLTVKEDGQPGVDGKGKDGKDTKPRLEVNGEEVATLNDGIKYAGDFGKGAAIKLNKVTNIKGNAKDEGKLSDGNIGVVANQTGDDAELVLKLAKDLKDLDSATFGPVDPETGKPADPKNTVSIGKDGISAGNKVISNVA
ncbi:hypothetical protein HPC37_10595, partial [Pasteurellaceae bacterium 20609_3]|uniref:ESPR-type extended signal peptide-containing protein n=1 Tax=Spirabiliibacterium mucosae TaxID=28156 RepID=UPI00249F03F5